MYTTNTNIRIKRMSEKEAGLTWKDLIYYIWSIFVTDGFYLGTNKVYLLCKVLSVLKCLKPLIRHLSTLKYFSLNEYSQ